MRKYLVFLFIPIFLFIWTSSTITAHKNPSDIISSSLKVESNDGVENVTLDKEVVYIECPWTASLSDSACSKKEAAIKVKTTAKNTKKNNINYYYIVTGGKIVGTGANVIWDLSEANPGKHTITVGIGEDSVISGNTMTKTVELKECPVCDPPPPPCYCPTISIAAPSKPVKSGDSIIFTANVEGGSQSSEISYEWRVSDGQIVGSKTSPQVLVSTANIRSNSITATIKIGGTDPCECPTEMSKTVSISNDKP